MRAGIFTHGFMTRFAAFWKSAPAVCLFLFLLPIPWATAAETIELECAGKSIHVVVPVVGDTPLINLPASQTERRMVGFGTYCGGKPVLIALSAEQLDRFSDKSDSVDSINDYVLFSRYKDEMASGIFAKGAGGPARLEYEEPLGMVLSTKDGPGNRRGVFFGAVVRDGWVVFCSCTVEASTETLGRTMVESVVRWVKDMNNRGFQAVPPAEINANGVKIVIPPPTGFERLSVGSATVDGMDNVGVDSFEFTSFSSPRKPSPEEGRAVFVVRCLKSKSFDEYPHVLRPLMLSMLKMKGDSERSDDARFGATFRMTPPEGGAGMFRPLSIKSRLVVVGLRVSPAKGGETAALEKEFDAWCEAILRENGEPEPGITGREESIFPEAD